jgi:hypothetical protein
MGAPALRAAASTRNSTSFCGGSADETIWAAVTFLKHSDSLPPAVAAEWHKKSND